MKEERGCVQVEGMTLLEGHLGPFLLGILKEKTMVERL